MGAQKEAAVESSSILAILLTLIMDTTLDNGLCARAAPILPPKLLSLYLSLSLFQRTSARGSLLTASSQPPPPDLG